MTWIQTASGRAWNLLTPSAKDICLTDIAVSLSQLCRFTGHTQVHEEGVALFPVHYSVAEHSVRVSRRVEETGVAGVLESDLTWIPVESPSRGDVERAEERTIWLSFAGLLHDAKEAYLGDWSSPLKMALAHFGADKALHWLERAHDVEIARFAGLGTPNAFNHPLVRKADVELLVTEARDLMGPAPKPWNASISGPGDALPPPLADKIEPWPRVVAEREFVDRYHELKERLER